jgi:hypothetical protein
MRLPLSIYFENDWSVSRAVSRFFAQPRLPERANVCGVQMIRPPAC